MLLNLKARLTRYSGTRLGKDTAAQLLSLFTGFVVSYSNTWLIK